MLYLQCGWPKTGTKELQAALFSHRGALATERVIYPERWRRQLLPGVPDDSHNGFVDVLDAVPRNAPPFEEFVAFLAAHAEDDVVLSSEMFFLRTLEPNGLDDACRVLTEAREVMPVKCVWTLRSFDEFFCSLYAQLISVGLQLPPAVKFLEHLDPRLVFTSMRQLEECADEASYVRYRSDGKHNADLLRALGAPDSLSSEIASLAIGSRLNPSFRHKQVLALLEVDSLSARSGVDFDPKELYAMFNAGEFEFTGDRAFDPLGGHGKRRLRERALHSASEAGPPAYVRFFGSSEALPDPSAGAVAVVPGEERLDDEDLASLVLAYSGLAGEVSEDRG
jgi:hypothetical protein